MQRRRSEDSYYISEILTYEAKLGSLAVWIVRFTLAIATMVVV
jgi:hypothetical protein